MTRVDDAAWVVKARKRKAYRDRARNKFFREVGLKKGANAQDIVGAPAVQASQVAAMLQLTAKGQLDAGHQKVIAACSALLQTSGLGLGADMAGMAEIETNLEDHEMTNLYKNWFTGPVFFD